MKLTVARVKKYLKENKSYRPELDSVIESLVDSWKLKLLADKEIAENGAVLTSVTARGASQRQNPAIILSKNANMDFRAYAQMLNFRVDPDHKVPMSDGFPTGKKKRGGK